MNRPAMTSLQRKGETMSRLASLEVDAVCEFIREWEALFNRGDFKSLAEYYAEDATLIATQMPTVRGRPAIEKF